MSKVVPEGWQLLELDDVTDKILGGGTPSRLEPSYWNGDIPWVSVKDLSGIRLCGLSCRARGSGERFYFQPRRCGSRQAILGPGAPGN